MMTLTENYWRKTGAKFTDSDEELENLLTDCGKQFELADEEGYFNSFLCIIDFKKCDKNCIKHKPNINPDIVEFVESLNRSLTNEHN